MPTGGVAIRGSARVTGTLLAATVVALAMVTASLVAPRADAQQQLSGDGLVVVLDSSGSMAAEAGGGQDRDEAASAAVGDLVAALPDDLNVGLVVYGHRVGGADELREEGCQDIETLVELAPLDRAAITGALDDIEPSGYTPIGTAVSQAVDQLQVVAGRRTVVLVSDGIDTCAPPPACEVVADLQSAGSDVTVETIGFQVDEAAREQLECIAEATGGSYRDAPDAASLAEGIETLSIRSLRPYLPVGSDIAGGPSAGEATAMQPGNHVDEVTPGTDRWYSFEIPTGQDFFLATTAVGTTADPLPGSRTLSLDVWPADTDPGGDPSCASAEVDTDNGAQPVSNGIVGGVTVEQGCTTGAFVARMAVAGDDAAGTWPAELVLNLVPPNEPAVPPGFDGAPVPPEDAPVGGATHSLAPLVTPGVHHDSIRSGEVQHWAVTVPRGATIEATATLAPADDTGDAEARLTVGIQNAARQGGTAGMQVSAADGGAVTTEVGEAAGPTALPGVHYVTVSVTAPELRTTLFDYDLEVVVTEPVAATTATPTPTTQTPTATESPATPTATPTVTPPPRPSTSEVPMPLVVGGLVLLLLGGGAAWWVWRNG